MPHHGAEPNWKLKKNDIYNHDIGCFVINYGLYNKYKHPNIFVLQNLISNVICIILNNEVAHFDYMVVKK